LRAFSKHRRRQQLKSALRRRNELTDNQTTDLYLTSTNSSEVSSLDPIDTTKDGEGGQQDPSSSNVSSPPLQGFSPLPTVESPREDNAIHFQESHVPNESSSNNHYLCQTCPHVSKTRPALNKHINATHNKRFHCDYHGCTEGPFGYRADVARHKSRAHANHIAQIMRCPFDGCDSRTTIRIDNFWRHLRDNHGLSIAEARAVVPLYESDS
jgi:hypothetical protein